MGIHWLFFPKTWTKGHWPLDDLWPHVCWGHMCDSTQGSLCPSPMTIHQCMWIQWSILQNTTYIHTHTTYILHTTYRMSDHIVSYWTQFRRDKKVWYWRFEPSGASRRISEANILSKGACWGWRYRGVFLPDLVRYIISFFNHFVTPVFKMVAANAHHRFCAVNLRSKQSRSYLYRLHSL